MPSLPPDIEIARASKMKPIEEIAAACRRHGIIAGIHCVDGASAGRFAERGFALITCFKDTTLIANAALREVASI